MISRFQPTRLTTPVLILLVIAAVSYWANPEAWQHLSMGTEALFAGSLIAIAGMIVLFRRRMYLQIDERGIEVQLAVGAPRTYLWQEIESAGIFRVRSADSADVFDPPSAAIDGCAAWSGGKSCGI